MKTKVINFELLYIDGEQSIDKLVEVNYKTIIDEISHAVTQGHTEIIGLLLMDGFLYKDNDLFFQMMKRVQEHADAVGIKKITLLPGMCENFKNKLELNEINFDIRFFDFTQWMIYNSYRDSIDSIKDWNSMSDKFLFLGGIPSRYNRIILLNKFYKSKMLENSIWSFFPPWTEDDIRWCRSALADCSDIEYENFIKSCSRSIDNRYEETKNYSKLNGKELINSNIYKKSWLKDPGFMDHKIFQDTCFSVISEGNAYDPAKDFYFLTEKTWRTVANKHPFIIAGYPEQVIYAKQRGLKTFEDYFLIKDYYLIDNERKRMQAVVKNTKYFLENFRSKENEIRIDIEHNFNLFLSIAKENINTVNSFSKEDAEKYFYQKGFSHLIRIANGI